MRGFMAGATRTGLSVAISTHEARSSAWPPAILASRSAVAGATTISAASRDSRMWPISRSSLRSNSSVNTRSPVSAPTDSGVTNSCAARVMHRAHGNPALAQAADQVQALVGGDAPADDQQHPPRGDGFTCNIACRDHAALLGHVGAHLVGRLERHAGPAAQVLDQMPVVDGRQPELGGADAALGQEGLDIDEQVARRPGHADIIMGNYPCVNGQGRSLAAGEVVRARQVAQADAPFDRRIVEAEGDAVDPQQRRAGRDPQHRRCLRVRCDRR